MSPMGLINSMMKKHEIPMQDSIYHMIIKLSFILQFLQVQILPLLLLFPYFMSMVNS